MGRQEAIWREGFVSRAGFPGPALGNILSQLGALRCVVCAFMVFWRGGMERGDSSQSYISQGLIRGDPSKVLACVTEVLVTSVNPTPLLPAFWTGVWWPMSPGFPCGGGVEGSWGASQPCLQAIYLLEEARAGPSDRSPG